MVTAKLLFQTIAGFSAIGGLVGGGFWLNNSFEQSNNNIIVVFNGPTADSASANTSKQNYSCVISDSTTNQTDEACEVYKLATDSPTTVVDLKTTMIDENKAETIETGKKYILKLDETKFNQIKGVNKKIEIKNAKGAKIVEFSPTAILSGTIKTPKTNLIIGQSFKTTPTANSVLAESNKYFCELAESTTITDKFECDIYKPASAKTTNTFTDTELAGLTKTTTPSEIEKDNFFAIDFKAKQIGVDELRNKKINLLSGATASAATAVTTFSYEQSLVGDLSNTTSLNKFAYRITPNRETYYVTQLTVAPTTNPVAELVATVTNAKIQNYKCKLTGGSTEDTACQLFAMPAFETTKKTVTFASAKAATTPVEQKSTLVKDAYFKLVINHSNLTDLNNWTGSEEKTIDLLPITGDENQKYGTLKILAKEDNTNVVGKSNFVVGKASSATTISDVSILNCTIGSATGAANATCDIYKFTTQPGSGKNYEDLNMQQISKITQTSDIVAEQYYVVDLKTQTFDFVADKNKSIKAVKTGDSGTEILINVLTPFVGHIEDTAKANNKAIFLN